MGVPVDTVVPCMACAMHEDGILRDNKVDTIGDCVRITAETIGPTNDINRRVVTNL